MTDICVKIYRCHLLYARKYWVALLLLLLLWHTRISDVTSSLVWPLPGTIPQFRDNWFKTQGCFTIKYNETNILSSTIYLKTNKNINTTRIQILHTVYASHYLNQWWKNHFSVLECYPHNLWRFINLVNLNLDYRRIHTSLDLNELRPRKIMNCQSPGDFLIKLVFQIFNLQGE